MKTSLPLIALAGALGATMTAQAAGDRRTGAGTVPVYR